MGKAGWELSNLSELGLEPETSGLPHQCSCYVKECLVVKTYSYCNRPTCTSYWTILLLFNQPCAQHARVNVLYCTCVTGTSEHGRIFKS